jgi:hypothetical protein
MLAAYATDFTMARMKSSGTLCAVGMRRRRMPVAMKEKIRKGVHVYRSEVSRLA